MHSHVDGGACSLVLWTTFYVRTMLTKVTKHSKNNYKQRNKLEYNSFLRLSRIIRNKTLPPIVGAYPYLAPFYLIVMDCWKYCKKRYKFARTSESWQAFSFRGPWPVTRGSAQGRGKSGSGGQPPKIWDWGQKMIPRLMSNRWFLTLTPLLKNGSRAPGSAPGLRWGLCPQTPCS